MSALPTALFSRFGRLISAIRRTWRADHFQPGVLVQFAADAYLSQIKVDLKR
jgi:hypothetical protein